MSLRSRKDYQNGSAENVSFSSRKDEENGLAENVHYVKPEKKYPGFRKNLYDYFSEYASNTGIHGFRYVGEQQRSLTEKLCWFILLCTSAYFCTNLLHKTWVKWDQSQIIVSFARSPTPVWQIPFPAITICSETKVRQRKYNFTEKFHKVMDYLSGEGNVTDEELQKFSDTSLICDNHLYRSGNKTTSFETVEHLMKIAPPFSEVFMSCKWTNLNESCTDLFSPILTEDGICFTFNMLDRSEIFTNAVYLNGDYMAQGQKSEGWNLENGYPKDSPKDTFPRRAMSAGTKGGMILLLRAYEQDLDYICRGPVQGFKVLLHNPTEVPRVATQYFRAPLNQEVVVSAKPDMMTTSSGLKNYDPHRRRCFFFNERRLKYFQIYTQQNCQVECVANHTLARCGCVAYHMPHEESTPICGSGSIACLVEADGKFESSHLKSDLFIKYLTVELLSREVESGISQNDPLQEGNCDCLPACTSITYNAETSQADFNWPQLFRAFKANFSEFPGIQITRLSIFFKDMQYITAERNELYGQTDFLAYCGGLLGLFTGLSFLSIVEIIYFLSLRLMCNVRRFGKRYWSGSEKLLNDDAYLHD